MLVWWMNEWTNAANEWPQEQSEANGNTPPGHKHTHTHTHTHNLKNPFGNTSFHISVLKQVCLFNINIPFRGKEVEITIEFCYILVWPLSPPPGDQQLTNKNFFQIRFNSIDLEGSPGTDILTSSLGDYKWQVVPKNYFMPLCAPWSPPPALP